MKKTKEIINNLDNWVLKNGNGNYVSPEFESSADVTYGIPESYGIQQVREEIKDFVNVILDKISNISE